MEFVVEPLNGPIGREIVGLDIERDIAPATAEALREAWLEHGVLVFKGIGTSPEVQLRLSRCFGELEPHPIPKFRHPDYPELILLTNQGGSAGPVYDFDGTAICGRIPWHTDLAFTTTPNAGALLHMIRKTDDGGQTGWLDMALAYDELDDAAKAEIEGLEAVYLFRAGLEEMRFNNPGGTRLTPRNDSYPDFPPVVNPLVWTHPETGRKILNVNTLNIERILGMDEDRSDALIERLISHAMQPQFQYIHDWANNDMVLWDNRRTLHRAAGHPVDQIRIVHRTTIKGTVAMGRLLEAEAVA
ncbi:hypothetical protein MB02_07675 [Croceicoccus estronivorus]|uniref:TauD/TfdA dioxygenase family protein n=1 Tax=Croceicoccus estronivorus TaxID=1172626 RepID=UPI00082E5A16|nr:TauD/TfdA family dioxygenase [Croceicoccus estronivorus]OCC24445.1 hypothetical protein MB02_07675 [Croceicoccus estronivorus]